MFHHDLKSRLWMNVYNVLQVTRHEETMVTSSQDSTATLVNHQVDTIIDIDLILP